ncbi:MAG: tetratricopeptide repeat protein [Chitinivibrionales bacterium]
MDNNKQEPIKTNNRRVLFYCGLIAVITVIAFLPALKNGFTNFDDDDYVVNNSDIRGLTFNNVAKIFSSINVGNYQPATMLTYLAEYQFFKLNPAAYHFDNLLLHVINCLLVFALFYGLSGKHVISLLVTLLFAIHPMRVESVAWISERKDLLSALFYFISLLLYIRYIQGNNRKFYWFCAISLLFSLLSKPMAVSQPFVLLLMDYIRHKKLDTKAILDKIPFFAIAAVFAVLTLLTQKNPGTVSEYSYVFTHIPILRRICVPFYGILFYLTKSILPFQLCAYYPVPDALDKGMNLMLFASPFLVIGIAAAIYYFRDRSRTLVFGSLFFLITALPVLQIVTVGSAIVAERYTYIPMLGFYFIFAMLLGFLLKEKFAGKKIIKTLMVFGVSTALLVFSCLTHERCKAWKDSFSLWNDVIAKFPVAIAFNSRGVAYGRQGGYDRAIEDFNQAIRINPMSALAYNNLGLAYNAKGDVDLALEDFSRAVKLNPKGALAYNNRGLVYRSKGDVDHALEDFSQAVKLNPHNFEAYYYRGLTYTAKGDIDRAIEDYSQAIKIKPMAEAYNNRGLAYKEKGDESRSIDDFTKAIGINPDYAVAYCNRGVAYFTKADYQSAIEDYTRAINLNPRSMQGFYNRGLAYKASGDFSHALDDFNAACGLGLNVACEMASGN